MLDLFLNETVLLKIIRQILAPCNIDQACTRKKIEIIAGKFSSHIIFSLTTENVTKRKCSVELTNSSMTRTSFRGLPEKRL